MNHDIHFDASRVLTPGFTRRPCDVRSAGPLSRVRSHVQMTRWRRFSSSEQVPKPRPKHRVKLQRRLFNTCKYASLIVKTFYHDLDSDFTSTQASKWTTNTPKARPYRLPYPPPQTHNQKSPHHHHRRPIFLPPKSSALSSSTASKTPSTKPTSPSSTSRASSPPPAAPTSSSAQPPTPSRSSAPCSRASSNVASPPSPPPSPQKPLASSSPVKPSSPRFPHPQAPKSSHRPLAAQRHLQIRLRIIAFL
jgi:hypothetical protein